MIAVKPISISLVNWKELQKLVPKISCSEELNRLGINDKDVAALPSILAVLDKQDVQYACKFCFLQFAVAVTNKPFKSIGSLDVIQLPEVEDDLGKTYSYIVSGTGDVWRQQVIAECRKENDPTRRKIFNYCYDYIVRTGLKSMFNDVERVQFQDTFILR